MASLSTVGSFVFSRSIDGDISRGWQWVKHHAGFLIVVLGACVRLLHYAKNHDLCFDERTLWGNIAGMPVHEFSNGLTGDQLAPFSFLMVERAICGLFGAYRAVGRIFPLACGLLALALYFPLALKVVSRRAALIALTLFAFSDDLIYFSCEVKQYSLDLAVAIVLSLATLHAISQPVSRRTAWAMAFLAIASPWLSFPAVFIVSGCGLTLIISSLFARRMREAAFWCAVGAVWAVSFVAAYNASLRVLSANTSMYVFWDFAFLPVWPLPLSVHRTQKTIGILLDVFVSPLNMVQPPWGGVLLPLFAFSIGVVSLARRSWRAWALFIVPIVLAMIASAIRRYPFHGRLILELVPAFFLLIALGADRLGDATGGIGKLGYKVLLVLLLGCPCVMGVNQVVFRFARDFSPHGDLRPTIFIRYWEPPGRWSRH
jgi:uncharacterized membrane protein